MIPWSRVLACSFDARLSLRALVAIHQVSARTLQRCALATSMAYLHFQLQMLHRIVHALAACPPLFVIKHTAWDETGERLRMPDPSLKHGMSTSTWQVMVARIAVSFGWEGASAPVTIELVIPPMYVRSPSAAALFYALHNGPYTGPIQAAIESMFALAQTPIVLDECDAASGNDKLVAHMLSLDASSQPVRFHDWRKCSLHQNHLILTTLLDAVGCHIISKMYSMALALRTCGYFMRLHHATLPVVSAKLLLLPGPAEPNLESRRHMAEVMQYILANSGHDHESSDNVIGMGRAHAERSESLHALDPETLMNDPSVCRRLAARARGGQLLLAILDFMALSHGPLWRPEIVHGCNIACCKDVSTAEAIASVIRRLLLRHVPTVPVASRWTKIGPCLDFIVGGFLCHGLLPALFDKAFSSFSAAGPRVQFSPEVDVALEEEMKWHAITGYHNWGGIDLVQIQFYISYACITSHS